MKKSNQKKTSCPSCQSGLMRLEHQIYFTWISGEMVVIPDFPLWKCVVCSYQEYDGRAFDWLQRALKPSLSQKMGDENTRSSSPTYASDMRGFFTIN